MSESVLGFEDEPPAVSKSEETDTFMDEQAAIFRNLKPVCIAVNQIVLRYKTKNASAKEVILALETALQTLSTSTGLDTKLADYVFFPLSFVFRESKVLPSRATEIALDCLRILIEQGWQQNVGVEVCKQLLVLFGFLCGGDPIDGLSNVVTEGKSIAAVKCINSLCLHAPNAVSDLVASNESESIPVIGHTISSLLLSAREASAVELQVCAIQALNAMESCLFKKQMLRNFLPGIVSGLTKVLHPKTKLRRSYKVLECGLHAMTTILRKTLSNGNNSNQAKHTVEDTHNEDSSWIAATSAQVKQALANVVGLRYHERREVLEALFLLCMKVVDDCSNALGNCMSLMLETLACICCQDADLNTAEKDLLAMGRLLNRHVELPDLLKASTYDWISALPRVLQSTEAVKRLRHVRLITTAYRILSHTNSDLSVIDRALAVNLQESTIASIKQGSRISIQSLDTHLLQIAAAPYELPLSQIALRIDSLAILNSPQNHSLRDISLLVDAFDSTIPSTAIKKQLAESLQGKHSDQGLAYLWLSSKIFRHAAENEMKVVEFVDDPSDGNDSNKNFMEVVYSHCMKILSETAIEDEGQWRQQAVALEIIAWQSSYDKLRFRSELVDALYPILERLGSRNTVLRDHAMSCLNIVSRACGYQSASQLVIENADYLVNSVAVKLNTFEISPQAPQVLSMMVQLCGPTIIPYLDDVVETIFATLACFHGYPRLAESLFQFLRTIIDVASLTSSSTVERSGSDHQTTRRAPITSVADVGNLLQKRVLCMDQNQRALLRFEFGSGPAANVPWEPSDLPVNTGENVVREATSNLEFTEKRQQLPTKSYLMIQSIVRLGQHYLTQESPKLRLWLLQLTTSSCNILASNEDEFLPLINDIWPAVVGRLYDPEAYICIAASETLAKISQAAGDFVSSRVEVEWSGMRDLYKRAHSQIKSPNEERGSFGNFGSAYQVWEALLRMFVTLVMNVRMEAEMEDEVMELLGPLVSSRRDVRDALESLNADTVWLQQSLKRCDHSDFVELAVPSMNGFSFSELIL
ncbi:hypothetical protein MMC13_006872 [Lambiella insularis]|nr:hypothetical protein [Lambiella insularis]